MTTYDDLRQPVTDRLCTDAVFLCGERCAAEVSLRSHRVGRVAMSPLDVLTGLLLEVEEFAAPEVSVFPGHLEKLHRLTPTVTARSRWFGLPRDPGFVVSFTLGNDGDTAYRFELAGLMDVNVNYVSKFRVIPNDTVEVIDDLVVVRDDDQPDLVAVLAASETWDDLAVESGTSGPASVQVRFVAHVDVPPRGTGRLALAVSGSDRVGVAEATARQTVRDHDAVFVAARQVWSDRVATGPILRTPHPHLDQFFAQCLLWGHKDARMVPLGAPFELDRHNAEVLALTASPDYHGVFANDNAQSAWELGALGPEYLPVLDHTLDVLFGHDVPESVEIDPIDATGRPWLSPLAIGERPQWVIGAAALILWAPAYADPYWPRIQRVLARFGDDDADDDWLDDHSSSTFPEQPNPGAFHHEMLYASAFWVQAFRLAATVAELVGDHDRVAEYVSSAERIGAAIERRFGTDYGYASWLDADHRQHPHRGHTMVLPLQYGQASPARAATTFATLLSPPLWSDDGPLAIEPAYPNEGADHAWGFLRWNLVHALYRYDRTAEATELLLRWAEQERSLGYQAPEGFPTITGVTGKGYVWTAARALRAMIFGLCGVELLAHGFSITPHLPVGWPSFRLEGLSFRGATYDLLIERTGRDDQIRLVMDGIELPGRVVPAPTGPGHHAVTIRVR